MRRVGVLTGGGDAPGLNAVIRAVVKRLHVERIEVVGFRDGYKGLVKGEFQILHGQAISGILPRGGTILGTSNRDNPFNFHGEDRFEDCVRHCQALGVESIIVIGGEGSLAVAAECIRRGLPMIGVPKTIDNDLESTDQTFGFDTAVSTATEALDRLHTTAESHHRVMVLEVMGRYAGWIALASGMAGGADAILIPEIPFTIESVARKINQRREAGKPFSIVVVAEGARTPDGQLVVKQTVSGSHDPLRLGGIGQIVATQLEALTGLEARVTVLGHVQRGGSPTAYDRILSTRYGVAAAELAIAREYGRVVVLRGNEILHVPIEDVGGKVRPVPTSGDLVRAARAIGICFGDS
ncbi:MAG: 6-phosphofructokinase [Bacillota bacterium]